MWTPSPEQAHRARTISDWFAAEIPRLFNFAEHAPDGRPPVEFQQLVDRAAPQVKVYIDQTIAALEARFGDVNLQQALTDFLFFPLAGAYRSRDGSEWRWLVYGFVQKWLFEHPSDYFFDTLEARARHMFQHVLEGTECGPAVGGGYYPAEVRMCLKILDSLSAHPRALEPIRAFVACEWNQQLALEPGINNTADEINSTYDWFWRDMPYQLGSFWNVLAAAGLLSETMFRNAATQIHHAVPSKALRDPRSDDVHPEVRRLADRVMIDLAADLSPAGLAIRKRCPCGHFYGSKWLIAACLHIEALGLAKIDSQSYQDAAGAAIIDLCDISGFDPQDVEEAVARLSAFSPRTLAAAVPHSPKGQLLLLRALKHDAIAPLIALVRRHAGQSFGTYGRDIPNCGDPESGVVDVIEIREAVAAAGEPLAKKYLKLLRDSGINVANTTKLVEAVLGWNAAAIETGVQKGTQQIAMKAFGLLPLSRGADEVLERYLRLRQIAKDVRQFGPERQTNTRAAIEAALTNLAATAGYADRTWLEWDMEARLSADLAGKTTPSAIDEWTVTLDVGDPPRVVVCKGGRELKAIPPKLKKHPLVLELKDDVDQLKEQMARVRLTLEKQMILGSPIAPDRLREVAGLLSARAMLAALVLRTADGVFGVYDVDAHRLRGLDGAPADVAAPVTIAHAADLVDANVLERWQREAVRLKLRQPFKQVFRELYLPTGAERVASESQRFAGQLVEPRRATRLFQSRRWEMGGIDVALPFRRFAELKLRAYFDFPDSGHFLSELESITSGAVRFTREIAPDEPWGATEEPVPIAEVPPLIFSEVMRDADLIVSVAALAKDRAWSPEASERRADALRAVAFEFGLTNITIDGSFARVTGKLKNYRIHLASGSVHVEPGGHVCTVPPDVVLIDYEHPFMPFPIDDEWKTADVISTVLLFANDHKIKNADLLAQIGVLNS